MEKGRVKLTRVLLLVGKRKGRVSREEPWIAKQMILMKLAEPAPRYER